jgi:energy-coupling factor transport system permease protein
MMLAGRVPLTVVGRKTLKLWPFLLLTFLLHAALSSHPSAAFSFWPRIDLNASGLATAGFFTTRLVVILALGIALLNAYTPQQYSRELARLAAKLPFWRAKAAHLELTISLALQFVPFLEQEYQRLNLALAARGEPADKTIWDKLTRNRKLLFPLMLNAFRRADQVSLALEARGFDPAAKRTSMNASEVSPYEGVATFLFAIGCVLTLWT